MSYTYTDGFKYNFKKFTSYDFINLLDKLNELFGQEYLFEPLKRMEGGIEFTLWPGKLEGEYKYITFGLSRFPWIVEDQYNVWKCTDEIILKEHNKTRIDNKYFEHTMLKAIHGAPCWTQDEISKFKQAFEYAGLHCNKKKICNLKSTNDLHTFYKKI